jgi:hypothetical protein
MGRAFRVLTGVDCQAGQRGLQAQQTASCSWPFRALELLLFWLRLLATTSLVKPRMEGRTRQRIYRQKHMEKAVMNGSKRGRENSRVHHD